MLKLYTQAKSDQLIHAVSTQKYTWHCLWGDLRRKEWWRQATERFSLAFSDCKHGLDRKPFNLRFPFAKLLHNFCGTKRKMFLSLRISFARKNNNLRNHSQKSFRAKLPYSAFVKLKFCAIPQFRKMCFLEFNSGKILFWNVFLLVTFT